MKLIATNKETGAKLFGDKYEDAVVENFIKDCGGIDNVEISEQAYNEYDAQKRKMNTDYNGTSVSLTSEDANALLQIKTAFELGATRTIMKFKNGTNMEMTPDIFAKFAPWFVEKRNEFFQ